MYASVATRREFAMRTLVHFQRHFVGYNIDFSRVLVHMGNDVAEHVKDGGIYAQRLVRSKDDVALLRLDHGRVWRCTVDSTPLVRIIESPRDIQNYPHSSRCTNTDDILCWTKFPCGTIGVFHNKVVRPRTMITVYEFSVTLKEVHQK